MTRIEVSAPSGIRNAPSLPPSPVLLPDASLHKAPFDTMRHLSAVALFFEGDQILEDAVREDLGDLLDPERHQRLVQDKLPTSWVAVVLPSRVTAEGFAAYDNLLQGTTLSGEPLSYKGQGYKASSHLAHILSAVTRASVDQLPTSEASVEAAQQLPLAAASGVLPDGSSSSTMPQLLGLPCRLIAFSKSGAVLNQLLTEMSEHEEARSCTQQPEAGPAAPSSPSSAAVPPAAPSTSSRSCLAAASAAAATFLDSITDVHYLDAGLNCRGVHLTDPRLAPGLGSRNRRLPLHVHFHGTPRQWQDRRRPWIAKEKDMSVSLLRGVQVQVTERLYFEGRPPSLRQHFEVIQAAQLG